MSSKKFIIIFNTWVPTRDFGFGIFSIWDLGFGISDLRKPSYRYLTTKLFFFKLVFELFFHFGK